MPNSATPSLPGSSGFIKFQIAQVGGNIGGNAGDITFIGRGGGSKTVAGTANVAGNGTNVLIQAGGGGVAQNGSSNTGGNGGDLTLESGTRGTGATANGLYGQILFKNSSTELARFSNVSGAVGNFGIGTGTTVSAKTHIIATTEQLRLGYDASNYFKTTVASTGSTTFALTGTTPTFTFSQKVIHSAPTNLKNYTVATLPAGVRGDIAYVTDGLLPAFLTAIVGGGAVVTPVFYNGAAWVAY